LAQWLKQIAAKEGYAVKELEYNFVDQDTMLSLNQKYLNHNTDTDIITFDYSETKEIKAEAYISCDALKKNAKKHAQTTENETCINLFHVKH
jgi:rRNA maturation RNase YbeY